MGSQLLLAVEGLVAVVVAGVERVMVADAGDLGVETTADSADEGILGVALVTEEVAAGLGQHADVDRVVANRTDLCLTRLPLRVFLCGTVLTLTLAPSKNTTSSS
jgi:hypothetical protein